ncbi:MAG TPA: polysaccharide deacetylase family protein [Chitinophagaceae bacterium]|nr:polysaccharide deacetylase family protein [Chitinophagaceae bacterium]
MAYFTRTPAWMRALHKKGIWKLNPAEKTVYLTFDDGPNPDTTPFILEELKKYDAKATFFCVGENVVKHPDLFQEIFDEGHTIGNHTHNHLKGSNTQTETYVENVLEAKKHIPSFFFRPPYGRIKSKQVKALQEKIPKLKIIMWDILSGDFDPERSPQKCLQEVLFKFRSGSIIVFHDSNKAWERMSYVLPRMLEHFSKKGYRMDVLPKNI